MVWQQTGQKGVFSRPIGENETFIKLVGDAGLPLNREHWAINSSVTVVPTGSFASANADLASRFRQAWAHLRFQHPSLAAEVSPDDDTRLIYTISADRAALVGTFSHAVGAIWIPCLGSTTTSPAGTCSAALALSATTTEAIVAACKARNVSVTAAVHASVAGANYALADAANKEKHYTSTVRFALRPHLPEPASAAGLYTTGWMKRIEAGTSWAERLREYQDEYRKGITRDFLDAHREYAKQLGDLIRQGGDGTPSEVDISSIGVAEKLIRRSYGTPEAGLEVRAVSVGVEILSRQAVAFVWTFRDRLNISVVYNEAFHSAEQMGRFVGAVKSELLEGLGVQDS
ncbi:hypothetical protein F4801DRAFT_72840 [Xylaria longipes]|nr:hypothetical protein F4801DRAFT_72840 [Xylaria longipes]